ncbi:hypothetical protein B0H13DRAFT_1587143, partial [Mycena leptocephala]
GPGVSGLTCAIALRRVGHTVVVMEREGDIGEHTVYLTVRMPPNSSEIFYDWDLNDLNPVFSFTCVARQLLNLFSVETGNLLGKHDWDKEILQETRGEFLLARVSWIFLLKYLDSHYSSSVICAK